MPNTNKTIEIPQYFTNIIRDEWLEYCKSNIVWLEELQQLKKNGISTLVSETSDGGIRPQASILLGILIGIYPESSTIINVCFQLSPDPNKIVIALGLNFDPLKELEKLAEKEKEFEKKDLMLSLMKDPEYLEVQEGLEEIRAQIKQLENSS